MEEINDSKNSENEKKDDDFELTELFMAKAGWKRCFIGTLTTKKEDNGNELLCCKVDIKKSIIISQADDREKLGQRLDILCEWVLDHHLHETTQISTVFFETPFYWN